MSELEGTEIQLGPLTMGMNYRDDGGGSGWKILLRNGKKAPLTGDSFSFAARNEHRSPSHSWRVKVRSNGDVYVMPRTGGEAHISLHASGAAHMKGRSLERRADVCHWTWTHGKPALQMVFLPKWGAHGVDSVEDKVWDNNDYLLGLDDEWGVVVSFARTASSVQDVGKPEPPRQIFPLARLEMPSVAEALWVWAEQICPPVEPKVIEDRVSLDASLTEWAKELEKLDEGAVLDLHLMGTTNEGDCGLIYPLRIAVGRNAGNYSV